MKHDVVLRDVTEADRAVFFEQQLDATANHMAAFTPGDPTDQEEFEARWTRILSDGSITTKTILFDGQVAGHIESFERFGKREVSYWLGRKFWDRGIATRALSEFLEHVRARPLYARVAKDNLASIRVLEKCGFSMFGEDKAYSSARDEEVEEYILQLGAVRTG